MDSENFVETKDLTKVYISGKIKVSALSNVNISLKEGWFHAITGPSGSGKSTLLNLLGGLDSPSSGTVTIRGKAISKLDDRELALYRRYEVGMIFQSFNLISSYTAQENVALPLLFAGVAKKERFKRAADILEKVGLANRKEHRPGELSGGEQQRVAIARAFINRPTLLLADEPTGNLDSKTSHQIVQLLSELNKNQNLTVIMISHEESLLAEYADNIIHMQDGKTLELN